MKQRNIARLSILTLTLVLLWSPNTLPFHSSSQAAQAPANAIFTNPNDQPTSRAVANGKIVFVSGRDGRSDIYTMNPDGSQVMRLTRADQNACGDGYGSPVWSPDGSKIAFAHHHCLITGSDIGLNEVFVTDSEAGNARLLTPLGAFEWAPAWSPDSTRIALNACRVSGVSGFPRLLSCDVHTMGADGSNRTSLTKSNPNEYAEGPSWSPDGLKIAFSWFSGNTHTVRVMNADGSNQREILNGYLYANPWSQDGSKLLVTPSGAGGLWTISPDGTSLTKIYDAADGPYGAAWSPDGSKVAISTLYDCGEDDCNSEVVVVNADWSHPTKLAVFPTAVVPTWSPDGKKILLGAYSDLFVMNADGSGVMNITNPLGGSVPSWQAIPITPSAIDDAQFFVRQQYLDFLNREPDPNGLAYWTNRIAECGSDARCIHERRIGVSAAFFIELEFQDTGYYVYRFYKASFGRQPNYSEFTADRSRVIGGSNLEANKQAFADEWVQRPAFVAPYPITMSNTEVVNKLFDSAGLTSSIYDPLRQQEILAMNAGRSRALVLRDVIEIPDFKNIPDANDPRYNELKQVSQYNPAFVLMQYFGYLRRDVDQNGYQFWLDVLNNREPNNYHGMVCAFITSSEYQLRFGSVVTRSNADCGR